MKHPNPEQWMDFLYKEMPTDVRQQISEHIAACSECRQKRAEYQGSVQALSSWQIEAPRDFRSARPRTVLLKWAAAAVILLMTGFISGVAGSRWAEAPVRVQIAAEREKLKSELMAEIGQISERAFAANQKQLEELGISLAALQQEHKNSVYTALQELEKQRTADYRTLRQDLEKVALFTDANLKYAQRQLVQLANYTTSQD